MKINYCLLNATNGTVELVALERAALLEGLRLCRFTLLASRAEMEACWRCRKVSPRWLGV